METITITIEKIESITNKDGETFIYKVNGSYRVRPENKDAWGLKSGMTGDVTTEVKTSKRLKDDGTPFTDTYITSWTPSTGQPSNGNGNANHGGYQADPERNASIAAQVVLKEAVATAISESAGKAVDPNRVRQLADDYACAYLMALDRLAKGVNVPPAVKVAQPDADPFEDE